MLDIVADVATWIIWTRPPASTLSLNFRLIASTYHASTEMWMHVLRTTHASPLQVRQSANTPGKVGTIYRASVNFRICFWTHDSLDPLNR